MLEVKLSLEPSEFGIGQRNAEGEHLIDFAVRNNLVIML